MPSMIARAMHVYLAHFRALGRNARLFLLSNVLLNLSAGAIGLLYLIFLERLGYTTSFLSVLLVVGIAGAGLGLIPAIPIANRYSARKLLLWSDLIGGIAAGAQIVFPTAAVLIITTFFVGASASIFIVLTPPFLAATSTATERDHLFSVNSSLGFITGVFGTLLGGILPNIVTGSGLLRSPLVRAARPWLVAEPALALQMALLIAGLLALPSVWPLFLMDDTIVGAAPVRAPQPVSHTARQWRLQPRQLTARIITGARSLRRWRGTRYMVYQAMLGMGAGLFLTYINPYFVNTLGMSTAAFGLVSSAGTILLAITSLLAPLLGARMGQVRGAVLTQLCSVPLLVALAFVGSVPLAVSVYLTRTVLMNTGQPLLQSFIMGALPPHERGAASSAFNVNWQVALAIGGVASGIIIDHAGYRPIFLIAGIFYASGMLLLVPWFGHEAEMEGGATTTHIAQTGSV